MKVEEFRQTGVVEAEVEALSAAIRPIILGTLLALKGDVVKQVGGIENISLELMARLYRPGSGDCGISFEYAVHDAIVNCNPEILERIEHALNKYCKIKGDDPTSILFGAEKSGTVQLIESAEEHLTDDSKLLTGKKGQPIRLKRHIAGVVGAFRKKEDREKLPESINGLWKADLFVGNTVPDKWVGTTVKINPSQLEGAKGLRLAIVPTKQGKNDKIHKNDSKNLIICPLPYDQSFMEIFYQGWIIVKQFLNADAYMPKEVHLPRAVDRQVCKLLVERRKYPVLDVLEFLDTISQPELLDTGEKEISVLLRRGDASSINRIVAPISTNKF